MRITVNSKIFQFVYLNNRAGIIRLSDSGHIVDSGYWLNEIERKIYSGVSIELADNIEDYQEAILRFYKLKAFE
jgi:hypothetical protein